MSIAKTIEISATSPNSFEDAIKQGIQRASKTIDGIRGVWIKEQEAKVENGQITEYRVHLKLTFVLKD